MRLDSWDDAPTQIVDDVRAFHPLGDVFTGASLNLPAGLGYAATFTPAGNCQPRYFATCSISKRRM